VSDFEARWRDLVSGKTRDWWAPAGRAGLRALSLLYGAGIRAYRAAFDLGLLRTHQLPCRVLSVGNLTVGGTGKTTTVLWLARRLQDWGLSPAILSYGYRAPKAFGAARDRVTVVSDREGVRVPTAISGDEAQLLARGLPGVPVLIGPRRVLSGRQAWEEFRPDVCVLDDAFQYWRLRKDLEIVLVNAQNPFGYGGLLPRGTLREPLTALRRAHAVIVTHARRLAEPHRAALREILLRHNPELALAEAEHVPLRLRDHASGAMMPLDELRGERWGALAALGEPGSFERTLQDLGAVDPEPLRFPDHHLYTERDLRSVRQRVEDERLVGVVTTEKDAVKIAPEWLAGIPCRVLEIDLGFLSGRDAIERLLQERIVDRSAGPDR
jgi:tetraacyldisaccharide 4'-kinase